MTGGATTASPGMDQLRCAAQIPVADLDRARGWYSRHLGLQPMTESSGELHYRCGGGTFFTLYLSESAGTSDQTVLAWLTPDLPALVRVLNDRGVRFEEYDLPGLRTGPDCIGQVGPDRAAWFHDSDGNLLAVGSSGIGLQDQLELARD
jgi:catechol 2,3-dioxygenase-like lactoylglutathione lyase family enzyme